MRLLSVLALSLVSPIVGAAIVAVVIVLSACALSRD